jgi:S-adenosylmethionine-diacylglycerol 3-amino-3-carboxypropyl transferase
MSENTVDGDPELGRIIPWNRYRDHISYSACNEDSASEMAVLRPGSGKRMVCICAGGGRVLNLLENGGEEIWAVDVNPSQTHLLELKTTAIRRFEYDDYLQILGVRPCEHRLDLYDKLRPGLSAAAQAYFGARPKLVARGALYQGSLERFFDRYVSSIMHLVKGRWIDKLFRCTSLAEQAKILPRWNSCLFRFVAQTICREWFFGLFSRDPGFWRFVPPNIKLHERIFELMHRYLENHLARENPLLWLVFHGRYADEKVMPRYLLPEPFARIKKTLETIRFEIIQGELGRVLEGAPAGHFDAFSISDISSYLSQPAFESTIDQVLRTARPEARFCSRGIFFHRTFTPEHLRHLVPDQALAQQLERDDHAMVHAFFPAQVQ